MSSSETKTIAVFERDTTITPSKLRSIGLIPATVYGKGIEPLSIQLNAHEFQIALGKGARKFRLEGMGKSIDAQVQKLQKVSTKEQVLHAEFWVPGK